MIERDELEERLDFTVKYNILEHLISECNEEMLVEIVKRVDEAKQDWGFTLRATKGLFKECLNYLEDGDEFETEEELINWFKGEME
jgi:hypothetical protein